MPNLDFNDLRGHRRSVREFVNSHVASVLAFFRCDVRAANFDGARKWLRNQPPDGPDGWKLDKAPPAPFPGFFHTRPAAGTAGDAMPYPLTTVHLLDSLLYCPTAFIPDDLKLDFRRLAMWFSADASSPRGSGRSVSQPTWLGADSADLLKLSRVLPLVLRFSYGVLDAPHHETLARLVESIVIRLDDDIAGTSGWHGREFMSSSSSEVPNAYLTYWCLRVLQEYENLLNYQTRVGASFADVFPERFRRDVAKWRRRVHAWTREHLALQIVLHNDASHASDTDELGWTLAAVTSPEIRDAAVWNSPAERALIRGGLASLMNQQTHEGVWRHQRRTVATVEPIADSSGFELMAVLLRSALDHDAGYLGYLLRTEYPAQLFRLLQYAETRAVPLERDSSAPYHSGARGWASGLAQPMGIERRSDGWTTASVYMYAQQLRRLVGNWTFETALSDLTSGRLARRRDLVKSDGALTERGQTWVRRVDNHTLKDLTMEQELRTLFVNPCVLAESRVDRPDPDLRLIEETSARSAILFGPPGTSKTSLAKAVASAIGWEYVEIGVADFLADGHDKIEARAASIFDRLLELDRTVVLFDEIDELLLEREPHAKGDRSVETAANQGTPATSSRFLTTSMLPKIAQLWEHRRVIFFAATNRVEFIDRAITRAQRFDAVLFVAYPGLAAKLNTLAREARRLGRNVDVCIEQGVWKDASRWGGEWVAGQEAENQRSWQVEPGALFAVLRHDEVVSVALHLVATASSDAVTIELKSEDLTKVIDYVNPLVKGGKEELDSRWRGCLEWRTHRAKDPRTIRAWKVKLTEDADRPDVIAFRKGLTQLGEDLFLVTNKRVPYVWTAHGSTAEIRLGADGAEHLEARFPASEHPLPTPQGPTSVRRTKPRKKK